MVAKYDRNGINANNREGGGISKRIEQSTGMKMLFGSLASATTGCSISNRCVCPGCQFVVRRMRDKKKTSCSHIILWAQCQPAPKIDSKMHKFHTHKHTDSRTQMTRQRNTTKIDRPANDEWESGSIRWGCNNWTAVHCTLCAHTQIIINIERMNGIEKPNNDNNTNMPIRSRQTVGWRFASGTHLKPIYNFPFFHFTPAPLAHSHLNANISMSDTNPFGRTTNLVLFSKWPLQMPFLCVCRWKMSRKMSQNIFARTIRSYPWCVD